MRDKSPQLSAIREGCCHGPIDISVPCCTKHQFAVRRLCSKRSSRDSEGRNCLLGTCRLLAGASMGATVVCEGRSTRVQLVQGRLPRDAIQDFFGVRNIRVIGDLVAWNLEGLSFVEYRDGDTIQITGDPLPNQAGRASHDASKRKAGNGSPSQGPSGPRVPQVMVTPLSGSGRLQERFTGITGTLMNDSELQLPEDAVAWAMQHLFRPILRQLPSYTLATEAAVVSVISQVLFQAVDLLQPAGPSPNSVLAGSSQASDEIQYVGNDEFKFKISHEETVAGGSFAGRIELQVVQIVKTDTDTGIPISIFKGAVEVKRYDADLTKHLEQAKKEAFAMWCFNARHDVYKPVWVVLTNLKEVQLVMYDGWNYPNNNKGAVPFRWATDTAAGQRSMKCKEVKGEIKVSKKHSLLIRGRAEWMFVEDAFAAVRVFMYGLWNGRTRTVEDLTSRLHAIQQEAAAHFKRATRLMDGFKQPPQLRPSLPDVAGATEGLGTAGGAAVAEQVNAAAAAAKAKVVAAAAAALEALEAVAKEAVEEVHGAKRQKNNLK